jgi:hypothetical protein
VVFFSKFGKIKISEKKRITAGIKSGGSSGADTDAFYTCCGVQGEFSNPQAPQVIA